MDVIFTEEILRNDCLRLDRDEGFFLGFVLRITLIVMPQSEYRPPGEDIPPGPGSCSS